MYGNEQINSQITVEHNCILYTCMNITKPHVAACTEPYVADLWAIYSGCNIQWRNHL